MFRRRDAGWFALMALLSVSLAVPAMSQTHDGSPPSEEKICDGLSGAAFGLCNAYCEALDCDSRDNHPVPCRVLRRAFEKATGSDIFPCDEVVATPTNTASPTDTPEATATDTPAPTPTDTPEPTVTDTAEPTVTDTPTGTPTGTAAATATDTPEPTVTDTPEPTVTDTPEPTVTDTPEPTVTDTPEPTVTDTSEPTATDTAEPTATDTAEPTVTDTPTGTPTGTAAATATDTPEPTVTDTPEPTVTDTPEPTVTDTPEPTATDTPEPTATDTPAPICPLEAGRYTITQMEGGTLQVASIGQPDGFPFPSGGTVVQDVGPGDVNCVHQTVVPASGGFSAPVFCIPGLNFSVKVTQNGCGTGRIDSNGGSDYTVTEIGDTSDSSATCSLPAVGCPPGPPSTMAADRDSAVRVDITVGNGAADTCAGGGTANAVVVIPVSTLTWLADDFTCPDADGVFDGADTLILLVNQNLDFTTDVSTSSWSDIDGDGCSIAGAGPAAGLTRTGVCLDLGANTVTTAATGTIGSDGSPLFDLTFATRLPNSLSGPTASMGATCATPPVINFTGMATRCIE